MTDSAEQRISAPWDRAVRECIDSISLAAINWKSWLLLAICLAVGVLGGLAFDSESLRDRLPLVLLALAVCIPAASLVLSRFCTRRCASCGSAPTDLAWDLDDCPSCQRSYCGPVNLLAGKSVLSLHDCLADHSVPLVTLFGMVLTLAIRDGASRIRLVGRKLNDDAEYPWATPCGSWSIWITVKGTDYEMVPPPRRLGTGMFQMLRETYRKLEKETPNGPARLPLALDDWSENAQLVIEETEKEQVATVIFPSEPREPVSGAASHLRALFFPPDDYRVTDPTPPATTWKHYPRFIPIIPKWVLPMDGSTLRLDDLKSCQDPHAAWLVPLLDYALDCRKEQIEFIAGQGRVAAHLSKEATETLELKSIDSWLCLELMAEFDRRARKRSGGDVATFKIVGSLREATATLDLRQSDGKRVATLNLDYGTRCRS